MKILIVPDSFKGTLTSRQVCDCIEKGIKEICPTAQIISLPFADGGEGFGECLSSFCNGEILYTPCSDVYGKAFTGHFYTFGKTAVIDCACASGIQKKKDVMNATSYGTGELIKSAVQKGFNNIILGLGGSGCCDGGAGALAALGAVFKDMNGDEIAFPKGKDLENIYGVSFINIVKDINFTYACDVNNPFYGKNGAAYVFAPQKGASKSDVTTLDNGLKMLNAFLPKDVSKVKGAGAAGGICGGLYSVWGGVIKSGFDILGDACELDKKISECDIVVTGEGKTDRQTLMGKLPYKIGELCKKLAKKCVVISGSIDGVTIGDKMISVAENERALEYSINNPQKALIEKARLILEDIK